MKKFFLIICIIFLSFLLKDKSLSAPVNNAQPFTYSPTLIPNGPPDFTYVYMGDIHNGYPAIPSGYSTNIGTNYVAQSIGAIISMKSAYNIKMFMSAGDLIDDVSQAWEGTFVSNQLQRLETAGISVFISDGNHDDAPNSAWDTYLGTNFFAQDKSFLYCGDGGSSTRNMVSAQTNAGIPFLFVSSDFASNSVGKTTWLLNACNTYSNSYVIAAIHSWLNSHESFANAIRNSESYDWPTLKGIGNLRQILSGHYRDTFSWSSRADVFDNGNVVESLFMNTQQNTNCGGNYIRFYMYYAANNLVIVKTYDSNLGTWLTNGTPAYAGSITTNGYYCNFSFPMIMNLDSTRTLRLQGLSAIRQGTGNGPGNWAAGTGAGTNTLLDTYIEFNASTPTNSLAPYDTWVIGRLPNTNILQFKYSSASSDTVNRGDYGGVPSLLTLGPNGILYDGNVILAGQTASISNTTNLIPVLSGLYMPVMLVECTVAGGGGCTLSASLNWTDDAGVNNVTPITSFALSTLGRSSADNLPRIIKVVNNTPIYYSTTVSGTIGSGQYSLYVILVKIE